MTADCRKKNGRETPEGCNEEKECFIKKIQSDSLKITGGCPECNTIKIELKQKQECTLISEMMPADIINFTRNGQPYCIKFSDFQKVACKICLE